MVSPYPTRGIVTAANLTALYADGEVFPGFPGRDWMVSKTPMWSTQIQTAASGSEVRAGWYAAPKYSFRLQHPVLRDLASVGTYGSELQQIIGFFNSRKGRYGFFFFYDPSDNTATAEGFASGDGTTTKFQLTRTVAKGTPFAAVEPVYALWGNPTSVTVAGVAKTITTDYTISPWGVITFTTAPANGAALVWSGTFLFVCRFDTDQLELHQLMSYLWEQQGMPFVSDQP